MLNIVLFALTSSPANLPMPPSINEVKSVAMSNVDGVTSNHLLPQMYGTTVLDEDVDLELSDEELESVVARGGNVNSVHSDVFYRGQKRIDYGSFLEFMRREPDGWNQISYVCNAFRDVLNCNRQSHDFNVIAPVIWQQLRDRGPVAVKQQRGGFTVDLRTGQLTFNR
jgi:hypothetical protein